MASAYVWKNRMTGHWMCDTSGMHTTGSSPTRTGWWRWETAFAEAEEIAERDREEARRLRAARDATIAESGVDPWEQEWDE